jgi:hypothetical protein
MNENCKNTKEDVSITNPLICKKHNMSWVPILYLEG